MAVSLAKAAKLLNSVKEDAAVEKEVSETLVVSDLSDKQLAVVNQFLAADKKLKTANTACEKTKPPVKMLAEVFRDKQEEYCRTVDLLTPNGEKAQVQFQARYPVMGENQREALVEAVGEEAYSEFFCEVSSLTVKPPLLEDETALLKLVAELATALGQERFQEIFSYTRSITAKKDLAKWVWKNPEAALSLTEMGFNQTVTLKRY